MTSRATGHPVIGEGPWFGIEDARVGKSNKAKIDRYRKIQDLLVDATRESRRSVGHIAYAPLDQEILNGTASLARGQLNGYEVELRQFRNNPSRQMLVFWKGGDIDRLQFFDSHEGASK